MGADDEIDTRSGTLWSVAVRHDEAVAVAEYVCAQLGLPYPILSIDIPSAELLDDINATRDLLDGVAEESEDGRYDPPDDEGAGRLVFDGVLTEGGELITLQLLVHEIAHHAESTRHGQLSGHEQEFATALREIIEIVWPLVADHQDLRHGTARDRSMAEMGAARLDAYVTKWRRYLTQPD